MSSIPPVSAAQAALLLQSDADLSARLALGQVVRAQVLERQEGNRYLMRILGQNVVAESASGLQPNDVLYGRVVGLKDRIELERVETPAASPQQASADEMPAAAAGGRAAEVIDELFRRYRATLDPRDAQALERQVARASRPERMALAGLILRKVGLALEPQLLGAMFETLDRPAGALAPIGAAALELGIGENDDGPPLAQALASALQPAPANWPPAQRVLNAQGGGAVSHRVGMLPLALGSRAIEVEFALFEEGEGREAPGLRHRKLVFAFDTEALGRVEARALTAGDHIRVALATESSAATNALLRYGEVLSRALAGAGWQVDEVSHETRDTSVKSASPSAAVAAAVEHLITPGSVDRLL